MSSPNNKKTPSLVAKRAPPRTPSQVVAWTVWRLVRNGLCGAVLCHLLFPYHVALCNFLALYMSNSVANGLISNVIHSVMYFGGNGLFMLMEFVPFFAKYKIPRKPHQVPSKEVQTHTNNVISHKLKSTLKSCAAQTP